MNRFGKGAKLCREMDKNTQAMVDLLSRTAAAYVHHDRDVPPELGNVLGIVMLRHHQFKQVRSIMYNGTRGPNVKKIVQRYLDGMKSMTGEVARLMEVLRGNI